jgi:hypothetical protein
VHGGAAGSRGSACYIARGFVRKFGGGKDAMARVVAFGSVKDESRLDYELCGDKAVEYIVNHHSNSRTGSVA